MELDASSVPAPSSNPSAAVQPKLAVIQEARFAQNTSGRSGARCPAPVRSTPAHT